jgi:hypothetical protein
MLILVPKKTFCYEIIIGPLVDTIFPLAVVVGFLINDTIICDVGLNMFLDITDIVSTASTVLTSDNKSSS